MIMVVIMMVMRVKITTTIKTNPNFISLTLVHQRELQPFFFPQAIASRALSCCLGNMFKSFLPHPGALLLLFSISLPS